MLSLIRATSSRTGLRDGRSARRLLRTLPSAPLDHRPFRATTSSLNTTRSIRSRNIHHSARLFTATAAEPAGDATPKKTPDDSTKDSAVDSTRQPAATATGASPLTKRRMKAHRGIGRATGRTPLATDPTSKVYVPSIPESFLTTHYHPASSLSIDNKNTFSSLPYHIHQSVQDEVLNTIASCLLTPTGPQAHINRMPARHNNVLLSNPWPVDFLARGFNPFVSSPIPIEFLEDLDDSSDDDFDDMDDDDDQDDNERTSTPTAVFVDSRIFSKGRHGSSGGGRHGHSSSTISLKEKFEKFWTALLLAEPKTSQSSLTASANTGAGSATTKTTTPKILFLRDIADIIHTSLGSTLIPSLTCAVLTLRKAGHNIMVVAGHSPSLLTSRQDELRNGDGGSSDGQSFGDAYSDDTESTKEISLVTILQKLRSPSATDSNRPSSFGQPGSPGSLSMLTYDTFPGPTQTFHHISIPPFVVSPPNSTSSVTTTSRTGAGSLTHPIDMKTQQRYALENAQQLKQDRAERIQQVNSRSMLAVLQFRGGVLSESESPLQIFGSLRGIDSEVWGFGKVYRIISNALGSLYLNSLEGGSRDSKTAVLSESHFKKALETSNENARLRKAIASSDWTGNKRAPVAQPLVRAEDCNRYERKLLGSIVDPDKIKTTFRNTITPAETVNALQTMITLPLIRPQLFSQGLLQNEFLSGLLLFGPPGTGKTLLAKAVAKESGARMLEIKASDIFDMYVGEGEKNVSAVFSLARKLSPCVIFLDEVDSIFRARSLGGSSGGGGGGHSSQREILNQFMVEWDGLRSSGQNNGIVVMASTNRPFELDDAVLRRLPRRILVDLPSEQAREKILNVYLGQETLDAGVDVKELAKKTALFSGSDLKNLCVSAALASVREVVESEVKALQCEDGVAVDAVVESDVSSSSSLVGSNREDSKEKDRVLDLAPLLDQYKQDAIAKITATTTTWPTTATDMTSTTTVATRVIHKRHFDKALAQITPSCSENMDSLTELRKWDGLYGDGGKGRRKAVKSLGFEVDAGSSNKTKQV
ncbi:hypothetical protein BGZ95_008137 [Linnemannia exigua]|uniref:AAA+ ATPase domain-containing protein n=1 Tax=Linnemannia exigua TaxID=604196 RepID=A0AAD4DEU1_9FUNG|nr:hypothetical protein BGZ95_008137 [Linnemannia exigua]